MSVPHFEFPNAPHIAGDAHDDDAHILDSLVESHAEPPTAPEKPREPVTALRQPEPMTRLLTGTAPVLPGWDPVLLVPADSARTALTVNAFSTAGDADVVRMADDKGKLMSQQACFLIRHEASFSGPHTGPVWVVADPSATGNITLSFVAVTK